jgi:hypothetical protein
VDVSEKLNWRIQYDKDGREYEYTMDATRMRQMLIDRANSLRGPAYKVLVFIENEWKTVTVK